MPRIAFLFLGGAHQVLHSAPVAAELSRDPQFEIVCLYGSDSERSMLDRVLATWPGNRCVVTSLHIPWLARVWPAATNHKIPLLLANRRQLAGFDAVVTTERTSTLLKRLSPKLRMIHLPHGAGDRARGFEPRLRWFDLVIVSGQKDAARMIESGVVPADRCRVSGSVKLGAIARLNANRPKLFTNNRPVVLYNPHFSAQLGSWSRQGQAILDWFAAQTEFNLIFAPHIRLFQRATKAERDRLVARAIPDHILIDPGSARSCDMTYTLGANIYLGDVSSQVYEFISQPRPCVFFDANNTDWENNPNYACWHCGEVVRDIPSMARALTRAQARHADFINHQTTALASTMGLDQGDAAVRAAGHIRDYMHADPPHVPTGSAP